MDGQSTNNTTTIALSVIVVVSVGPKQCAPFISDRSRCISTTPAATPKTAFECNKVIAQALDAASDAPVLRTSSEHAASN